jgi:ketosteroid isomerase-like protein
MDQIYHEIEQIKQLKYRYVRALDTADMNTMRDCLSEDAQIFFEGGIYTVDYQGREKICAFLETSFHSKAASSHQVHHPVITLITDTAATGQWSLSDVFHDLTHRVIVSGASEYFDEYVKESDGKWRIARSSYKRLYEMTQKMPDDMHCTFNRLAETGKDLGLG